MERSFRIKEGTKPAEFVSTYDLEQQLELAERRYAMARAGADKARAEWRELLGRDATSASALQSARTRFEAVAARCTALRDLIDDLEQRLET